MSVTYRIFHRNVIRLSGRPGARFFRIATAPRHGLLSLLDRVRRWLWTRWSEPEEILTDKIEARTVSEASIQTAIRSSQINLEKIWAKKARHVILGPDQLGLVLDDATYGSVPLTMSITKDREARLFGLAVHLVPWFDGCLLLPDLEECRV